VVVYFLFTSIVAVILGVGAAFLIKPGKYVDTSSLEKSAAEVTVDREKLASEEIELSQIPSAIISAIPTNPLGEMVETEMLKIVIFAIIVGIALISLKPKQAQPLLNLLGSIQSVAMKIVGWAMKIVPLAVFGLIAQLTIQTGVDTLAGIGVYVLTVLAALMGMLIIYLIIAMLWGGWSPWKYLAKIKDAQLLAFSTDSSVATMPLSIKTAQEKLKVRPSISQFIIPVGATVNMDATALFQGVATIFITQVYDLELGMGMLLVLIATAVGSSIGTPATPGVGIIVLSAVLKSVGVPLEGLALIIGVDRILEMFRTSVNVTGDLTASVVMNKMIKGGRSYEDELKYQEALEKKQKETGEDVITGEVEVKNEGFVQSFFHKVSDFFQPGEEAGK
jgi:Na+/H+-dicarboxylate symporter